MLLRRLTPYVLFILGPGMLVLGCGSDTSKSAVTAGGTAGSGGSTLASDGGNGNSRGGSAPVAEGTGGTLGEAGAAEDSMGGADAETSTGGPDEPSGRGGSGSGGMSEPAGPEGTSAASGGGGASESGAIGDSGSGGTTSQSSGGAPGAGGAEPEPQPAPVLEGLEVTGAQVPLKPSFRPERARYSFVPTSFEGTPALIATAQEEFVIQVNGTIVGSGEPVALPRTLEGTSIEVVVTNSNGVSRAYDVKYLPAGFPDLRVTVAERGASQAPIYVTLRRGNSSSSSYVTKFDNAGVPLFYVSETIDTYDFKKHAPGFMSYARGRINTEHRVLDQEFNELTRVKTVGLVNTDVHEFHMLPNGNQILLAYEEAERDLTPYGGSGLLVVQDAVVQEVSAEGAVLFQWNSWGELPYDESLYPSATDYAHVNSVSLANDGDWLISVRGFSQVIKVEPDSGDIVWRLGGMSSEFTFVDDPLGGFCGQHTASQLANGNLLVFDNGLLCWPENPDRVEQSRVAEYEIDEEARTARLVWSYARPDTYVVAQGSAQRLPNGNTFVGWGSNTSVLASEIDPAGEVVFEVQATSNGGSFVSYRAWRFPD